MEDKYKTWDKIYEPHGQHNLPWANIGDFNEILFSHEKEGKIKGVLTSCKLSETFYLIAGWNTLAMWQILLLGNVDISEEA
jgi:hypothetical protein